jgi:hypothetical protein
MIRTEFMKVGMRECSASSSMSSPLLFSVL